MAGPDVASPLRSGDQEEVRDHPGMGIGSAGPDGTVVLGLGGALAR